MLLNASGCLDALAAPDVARSLDAFVTKTVTPLPPDDNPPVRIAETEVGMLNTRMVPRSSSQMNHTGVDCGWPSCTVVIHTTVSS